VVAAPKPGTAGEYSREESRQVEAACLTLAGILGDLLMDDLCIVGGLVPAMICGTEIDPSAAGEDAHCGTTDLDVGLSVALLDDERYKEVGRRLRGRGFEPDENDDGKKTRQRWRWQGLKVTVDFLMPPVDPAAATGTGPRLQNLEGDLAALVVRPLRLAFDERVSRELDGLNLLGDRLRRTVNFAGPAAFVAMKAFAYRLRGEAKDTYDLVFVIRNWPGGTSDVAARLIAHRQCWADIVDEALGYLSEDFESLDSAGPRDFSRFVGGDLDDDRIADAHGAVADLLGAVSAARSASRG
jgi:hypothetical protein